ncbi:MAG: DUF882 domain-containing protein [Thiohalobacterales bacterium]|nr:DUF882 domain-containing protein [Thiohalobacterales bacterium]
MDRSKDVDRQSARTGVYGRRDFLRLGTATATALLAAPVFGGTTPAVERQLRFQNTHTGESVSSVYWAGGDYIDEGLQEINGVLRDHRTDEIYPIDTSLLDLLFLLQASTENRKPFQVISGYRSPKTNQALRSKSAGVAKRSYHMRGKAIDVRLPGVDLKQLHRAAIDLKAGGVGYYPGSGFIHVDVGPKRSW